MIDDQDVAIPVEEQTRSQPPADVILTGAERIQNFSDRVVNNTAWSRSASPTDRNHLMHHSHRRGPRQLSAPEVFEVAGMRDTTCNQCTRIEQIPMACPPSKQSDRAAASELNAGQLKASPRGRADDAA